MKCEKCGEEMNECTVDGVDQVSCVFCSEVSDYDRGWNAALEAVKYATMKYEVPKVYGYSMSLEKYHILELLNTLKK